MRHPQIPWCLCSSSGLAKKFENNMDSNGLVDIGNVVGGLNHFH